MLRRAIIQSILILVPLAFAGCVLPRARGASAANPVRMMDESGVKWDTFGSSVQGKPLYYTSFGQGDDVTLIVGAFHGNERATPFLPLRLIELFKENPTLLGSGRQVVIVPILNPDGYAASTRRNANQVDLNRNYPTSNWGQQPSEAEYLRQISFGPAPASEPETQAMLALLAKYNPDKIISIHQPLLCNNPDGPAGQPLAELMAQHNNYPIEPYIGFPTPGSFGTYAGKEKEIPMVTLELPRGGTDSEFLDKIWEENREALLAAIRFEVAHKVPAP